MLSHFQSPINNVKDLATDQWPRPRRLNERAALRTGFGSMNDNLIGLRNLSERCPAMTELPTNVRLAEVSS